jgi:hypothetical protein
MSNSAQVVIDEWAVTLPQLDKPGYRRLQTDRRLAEVEPRMHAFVGRRHWTVLTCPPARFGLAALVQ